MEMLTLILAVILVSANICRFLPCLTEALTRYTLCLANDFGREYIFVKFLSNDERYNMHDEY